MTQKPTNKHTEDIEIKEDLEKDNTEPSCSEETQVLVEGHDCADVESDLDEMDIGDDEGEVSISDSDSEENNADVDTDNSNLCLLLSDPECDMEEEQVQTDCGQRHEAPPSHDLREPGGPEGQLCGQAGKASHAHD